MCAHFDMEYLPYYQSPCIALTWKTSCDLHLTEALQYFFCLKNRLPN